MILRFMIVACDAEGGTCGEEAPPAHTEKEARSWARDAGFKVGRSKTEPDLCPKHREELCP